MGLGNIGDEYRDTRHNIGFMVVDALAREAGVTFEDKRYGFVAEMKLRGHKIFLLKPSTYMNLSGNAVRYWTKEKKIEAERLMIVSDDLALSRSASAPTNTHASASALAMSSVAVTRSISCSESLTRQKALQWQSELPKLAKPSKHSYLAACHLQ